MPRLTSVVLTALSEAQPERVWEALTTTRTPLSFLHDLIVDTDWQPGSTVSMRVEGVPSGVAPQTGILYGEVLAAERPRLLSYTLGERPGETSTYVTWQLSSREGSTIVRLFADEPGPCAGSPDELELIWLRIVTGLVRYLDRPYQPRWPGDVPGHRRSTHKSSDNYFHPARKYLAIIANQRIEVFVGCLKNLLSRPPWRRSGSHPTPT